MKIIASLCFFTLIFLFVSAITDKAKRNCYMGPYTYPNTTDHDTTCSQNPVSLTYFRENVPLVYASLGNYTCTITSTSYINGTIPTNSTTTTQRVISKYDNSSGSIITTIVGPTVFTYSVYIQYIIPYSDPVRTCSILNHTSIASLNGSYIESAPIFPNTQYISYVTTNATHTIATQENIVLVPHSSYISLFQLYSNTSKLIISSQEICTGS